jgi:hypothetical protein
VISARCWIGVKIVQEFLLRVPVPNVPSGGRLLLDLALVDLAL